MTERLAYLIPFSYFWCTRLRVGSVWFHFLFEWLAAAVVVVALGGPDWVVALGVAGITYLAFISLYELGYMANDLRAARSEGGGRLRGPQGAPLHWIVWWVVTRFAVFVLVTIVLGKAADGTWWTFFGGLAVVFFAHNRLNDRELKAGTFMWLSWFRFMAPLMFAVPTSFLTGLAFACAMSYSAFRQFGYLDSKGLLVMPGRKRPIFRWSFFMWPILGAAVLWPLYEAKGCVVLVSYYALVASLGIVVASFNTNRSGEAS